MGAAGVEDGLRRIDDASGGNTADKTAAVKALVQASDRTTAVVYNSRGYADEADVHGRKFRLVRARNIVCLFGSDPGTRLTIPLDGR